MKLQQQINLANEIWLAMNELPKLVPTYLVSLNLNPYLIYTSEDLSRAEITKELKEYINSYSDIITIVRILKSQLCKDL